MSIPKQSPSLFDQINTLHNRFNTESQERRHVGGIPPEGQRPGSGLRPTQLPELTPRGTPSRTRKTLDLPVPSYQQKESNAAEIDKKMQEIMKLTGILEINCKKYPESSVQDLDHIGELGSGTCGLVVKMLHKPSNSVIAVKQMRRSGNNEENKRIIMDLDVVLKSHDCPYIVQCLGCFVTESDVWICMELMATCFDKLLKKLRIKIPEDILGKVTCATVKALDYLKEKHGVIHRDVKPSNILLDERGNVKLCDFGISGRLVDSKAQTTSAGCAAYLAPERIAPQNPNKPDYDIRADVWSLGITLIELATGVFPYRQCKSDFEVLAEVVTGEPPKLPLDQEFSPEFRSFVNSCLTKNYKERPKYKKLLEHRWMKKADASTVDVGAWFARLSSTSRSSPPLTNRRISQFRFSSSSPRPPENGHLQNKVGKQGDSDCSQKNAFWTSVNRHVPADSRFSKTTSFFNVRSTNSVASDHSSDQPNLQKSHPTAMNLLRASPQPFPVSKNEIGNVSHIMVQSDTTPSHPTLFSNRITGGPDQTPSNHSSRAFQRFWEANPKPYISQHFNNFSTESHLRDDNTEHHRTVLRSQSPASQINFHRRIPTAVSNDTPNRDDQTVYSNYSSQNSTSHAISTDSNSESKRYSCYLKFNLGGSSTRTASLPPHPSRQLSPNITHSSSQSPEPPPRFNRLQQKSDDLSSSPLRRAFLDHSPIRRLEESPSLPRRYISPILPQPPPRRITECSSVPGSPQNNRVQHFRTRLHYTPEPQRRIFDSGQQF